MAVYDPPQPLWKRNLAGVLDFLLTFVAFGFLASKVFGNQHVVPAVTPPGTTATELFSLGTWPLLLVLILIIAYFVILGRTGGTIFQRIFGMRRVS